LGDGDAVSVCSALRKNGKKFNSPVIVVSSDPDAEIPAYAECRAVCFLLKGARTVLDLPAIVERTMLNNKMVRCGTETGMEPSF